MPEFKIVDIQYKRVKTKNTYKIEAKDEDEAIRIYNGEHTYDFLEFEDVLDEEIDDVDFISINEVK